MRLFIIIVQFVTVLMKIGSAAIWMAAAPVNCVRTYEGLKDQPGSLVGAAEVTKRQAGSQSELCTIETGLVR